MITGRDEAFRTRPSILKSEGRQWVWQQNPPATVAFAQPNWATGSIRPLLGPYDSGPYVPHAPHLFNRPPLAKRSHLDLGQQHGPSFAGQIFRSSGPSGPHHASGAHYVSQQSPGSAVANCVDFDGSSPNVPPEAIWYTKSRARVFDVDNSQGVGVPRILDVRASDFLDTSRYGSSYGMSATGSSPSNVTYVSIVGRAYSFAPVVTSMPSCQLSGSTSEASQRKVLNSESALQSVTCGSPVGIPDTSQSGSRASSSASSTHVASLPSSY
ncbi:hypothetical protein GOBAR_AA29659 [Gossypium barbadense]|uniref:Uncharacterized protein n=1 Tax=Gossypium barbadense TaxID=3634 RepID=A0A2P5WIY3_GOSBA|nr:hypothetical protein GOBAR_AA29659 [Gossypium barbadense]